MSSWRFSSQNPRIFIKKIKEGVSLSICKHFASAMPRAGIVKLTDRRFNISRSPCSLLYSLSTTVLPKKRGVMMDLVVYGVYRAERDMSGRAAARSLLAPDVWLLYVPCIYYIHSDLILLMYVYYSIYYRVIFSSVIRCIGSTIYPSA